METSDNRTLRKRHKYNKKNVCVFCGTQKIVEYNTKGWSIISFADCETGEITPHKTCVTKQTQLTLS